MVSAITERLGVGGRAQRRSAMGKRRTIKMLSGLARAGTLIHSSNLNTFIGFAEFLSIDRCHFEPMGTNRAVSAEVVAARVARNISAMRAKGKYLDFATIFLIVVQGDDVEVVGGTTVPKFYVSDGQHRLETMKELARMSRAPIHFQLRCKVCADFKEAMEELFIVQETYPPDARCFFKQRDENRLASAILAQARERWPALFKVDANASKSWEEANGRVRSDPKRPKLNDAIVFDILRFTGTLTAAVALLTEPQGWNHGFYQDINACSGAALGRLCEINAALEEGATQGEGEVVSK
ncbi:hypothetical protein T484DRAFT_1915230, partial [Baffinella frigidus]